MDAYNILAIHYVFYAIIVCVVMEKHCAFFSSLLKILVNCFVILLVLPFFFIFSVIFNTAIFIL